jgi:hypothetical protein
VTGLILSPIQFLVMGRGSRPIRRWKADRQRKKKARERKAAAPTPPKK